MENIYIVGSTAWSKWKPDGTIGPESKGHYTYNNDDGEEVALCGVALPDTHAGFEFHGGAYVNCKRCNKKREALAEKMSAANLSL